MKTTMVGLAALLGSTSAVWAQVFSSGILDIDIPDGDANGVSHVQSISVPEIFITGLTVQLSITGTGIDGSFNGDLYAYLVRGGTTSVLLNRAGRRADDAFGYADSAGLDVTFAMGPGSDIHNYRMVLSGDHSTPLGGPLTGVWQADGRAVDPAVVLDTTSRDATLDGFHGGNPNGDWTLFVADLSPGGTARLESWSLTVSAEVPEWEEAGLLTGVVLGAFAIAWRQRRRTGVA